MENILLEDPKAGDAIKGTGGLRKLRVPMESKGKGKRGGARVLYVDIELKEKSILSMYTARMKIRHYAR